VAWDGGRLPAGKADCGALVGRSAAAAWWPDAAPPPPPPAPGRAAWRQWWRGVPRPLAGAAAGAVGAPPAVLLRLKAIDLNIAHAAMKLLALHHVLRHPGRYGLPPAPAVVVHLADRYIGRAVTNGSTWSAGLLAAVLAASPTGGVTITERLDDTPAAYAAAAVVGSWSNRVTVGVRTAPAGGPLNAMARDDYAALHAVLPLPPDLRAAAVAAAAGAAAGAAGAAGAAPAASPPPWRLPLRVVYLSRRLAHRRRFDAASEARLVAALGVAAAAGGGRLTVVPCTPGLPLAAQLAPLVGAAVIVGVHGAALTTAVVGAWAPAPPRTAGGGGGPPPGGGNGGPGGGGGGGGGPPLWGGAGGLAGAPL